MTREKLFKPPSSTQNTIKQIYFTLSYCSPARHTRHWPRLHLHTALKPTTSSPGKQGSHWLPYWVTDSLKNWQYDWLRMGSSRASRHVYGLPLAGCIHTPHLNTSGSRGINQPLFTIHLIHTWHLTSYLTDNDYIKKSKLLKLPDHAHDPIYRLCLVIYLLPRPLLIAPTCLLVSPGTSVPPYVDPYDRSTL